MNRGVGRVPGNGYLSRPLDGMLEEYRSTTSRWQSRSFETTEVRLPSALLSLVIPRVDEVRSPLEGDLKSQNSTCPLRCNLKTAFDSVRYSSLANPSCLISIRSISRPAASFISIKPSLDTEQMGSPFQSNHCRWVQAIVSNRFGTSKSRIRYSVPSILRIR